MYLFEREKKREDGGRRRERISSRLPNERGAGHRAPFHDPGIMT